MCRFSSQILIKMNDELLKLAKEIQSEVDEYREADLSNWIAEEIDKYSKSRNVLEKILFEYYNYAMDRNNGNIGEANIYQFLNEKFGEVS